MKEGDLERLQKIADFEDTHDMSEFKMGWCWRHVGEYGAVLNRLFIEGYLENVFRSRSYTGYRLSELGRAVIAGGQDRDTPETPQDVKIALPGDLFEVIEGYEDIKTLVKRVLDNEKPVHILFTGVPSSAKTMFLLELARCGAPYVLGSQSTKAGIADLLFDSEPDILLVDEIDRIGTKDIAVLLSLTQTGIVSETKMGRRRQIKLRTKVFAASNTLKMAPELLSRFMVLRFKPYSRGEFLLVATNLLRKTEGIDSDLASYITEKVWNLSQRFPDPRQAVRVARLAKTKEEVDGLLQTIMRYSDAG